MEDLSKKWFVFWVSPPEIKGLYRTTGDRIFFGGLWIPHGYPRFSDSLQNRRHLPLKRLVLQIFLRISARHFKWNKLFFNFLALTRKSYSRFLSVVKLSAVNKTKRFWYFTRSKVFTICFVVRCLHPYNNRMAVCQSVPYLLRNHWTDRGYILGEYFPWSGFTLKDYGSDRRIRKKPIITVVKFFTFDMVIES